MVQSDLVRKTMLAALLAMACSSTQAPTPATAVAADAVAIPEKDAYERNMRQYGTQVCQTNLMNPGSLDGKVGATYYDAEAVFYQIGDYFSDASWVACATSAEAVYRDTYVMRSDVMGGVPGYWNFAEGLYIDFKKSGDAVSKDAVHLLATKGAYCSDTVPAEWTAGAHMAREGSFCLLAMIRDEQLGKPHRARQDLLTGQLLNMVDLWASYQALAPTAEFDGAPQCIGKNYFQPFMAGLLMRTLIESNAVKADPRIPQAIKKLVDFTWAQAWNATDKSFWYENCTNGVGTPWLLSKQGAPDLNLLIAPAFAWLYNNTGDAKYRDQGDAVFAGGVTGAWLDGAKQFNQNYMWSPNYIRWRGGTPNGRN
jgi:hypothetical protein